MKKYLFFLTLVFPSMLHAQKNSQWRGENRDGIYNETGLLKVWPANGPQLLWKFEGLGEGHTSVAIANGKIYINGMHGDILTLFVFDMKGKLLTKKEIGKEWNTSQTARVPQYVSTMGNYISSTPLDISTVWTKQPSMWFGQKTFSPILMAGTSGGVYRRIR